MGRQYKIIDIYELIFSGEANKILNIEKKYNSSKEKEIIKQLEKIIKETM